MRTLTWRTPGSVGGRTNRVLQTPCSSTVEFVGWFKFLIKTGMLCDVWYTCCASTSSHYNLLWFRFFFFFYDYFNFPHALHFWPLDVSLYPVVPKLWNLMWRPCLLPSFVCVCVLVHINIRTLYVFHALSTRGWTRQHAVYNQGALWCSLVSVHVIFPMSSCPLAFPLHQSFLVKIPCTLQCFFACSLTIFICKYTSAFNDSHLFLFLYPFSSYPKLSLICCASCNNQPCHLSSHPQWCVTCYGAI